MVEALLKEVVSAGRTEIILAAGEHLAGKIKGTHVSPGVEIPEN